MSALAVAPATEPAGYEQQVAELVDLDVLVARGLDISDAPALSVGRFTVVVVGKDRRG